MNRPFRLAVLNSHPIQYFAPLYRRLAQRPDLNLTVYYCSRHGLDPTLDPGFGQEVQWDVPLLEGYRSIFLKNSSRRPGLNHFFGLFNPTIISELRMKSYDAILVHGYTYATHCLVFLLSRLIGLPLFLRGESTLTDPRPGGLRIIKQAILRPLLHQPQACLYIGSRNRQFYEYYGVDSRRLIFTPYSVDDSFFRDRAQRSESREAGFRKRFGIPADMPVILAAGKLIPKKQPLHLLRSFEQLRRTQRCALVFAGEGELRTTIERECVLRSISDVYITGFLNQTEMPAAYAAADILVLPSAWGETWGLVVNEGMNCGLPVVVTDRVGCAGDLVRDGENGYVVPWNDIDALILALEKLVGDRGLRDQFARHSIRIIQEYHVECTVDGIIKACQGIEYE